MRTELFDFTLPDHHIALWPVKPRHMSRMLVVQPVPYSPLQLSDRHVADLPDFLSPGDALVINNTRVIPAQLRGFRKRGEAIAHISVTLHRRLRSNLWCAFGQPARKIQEGDRILFHAPSAKVSGSACLLSAYVLEKRQKGEIYIEFPQEEGALEDVLHKVGQVPLPPYIVRGRQRLQKGGFLSDSKPSNSKEQSLEEIEDREDYQTMFACVPGAVAAPTAGLHFTPELLQNLQEAGISFHHLTLHVGAGTFLPVTADETEAHVMHKEFGIVSATTAAALNQVRAGGGRIVAIGTTSLRLLESACNAKGQIQPFEGETDIFITPGYKFKAVDVLMTNFHLPKSTLFMLVCAFSGLETMQQAYAHAIDQNYRFYSYGDACLLFPLKG